MNILKRAGNKINLPFNTVSHSVNLTSFWQLPIIKTVDYDIQKGTCKYESL